MKKQDLIRYESAMLRALEIAKFGPENNDNPRVGAVLINDDGRIIAEGWHRGKGTDHAEVDALKNLPTEWAAKVAQLTAVVTLEPCNHTGERGPCSAALLKSGIKKVVYALADPGETSSGGAETLRKGGVTVLQGVLENESRMLLAEWLARNTAKPFKSFADRPYVIAKWAQTLDARAAAADGSSKWITGKEARAHVHTVRAMCDGIVAGTGTIIADDPALTARKSHEELHSKQPLPIVFGTREIPEIAKIYAHPKVIERRALKHDDLQLEGDPLKRDDPLERIRFETLSEDLSRLKSSGVSSLYIEGGPATISAWLQNGVVDELHIYVSPKLLGGPHTAVKDLGISNINDAMLLKDVSYTRLGEDILICAKTPQKEK